MADPAQVVEADLVKLNPIRRLAQPLGHLTLDVDRHVAQPDGAVPGVQQRLGHHPHRIREVDDPRVRSRAATRQLGQLQDDRDGAQRLGESAGAGRLLPDGAEPQGERLVHQSRRLPLASSRSRSAARRYPSQDRSETSTPASLSCSSVATSPTPEFAANGSPQERYSAYFVGDDDCFDSDGRMNATAASAADR